MYIDILGAAKALLIPIRVFIFIFCKKSNHFSIVSKITKNTVILSRQQLKVVRVEKLINYSNFFKKMYFFFPFFFLIFLGSVQNIYFEK